MVHTISSHILLHINSINCVIVILVMSYLYFCFSLTVTCYNIYLTGLTCPARLSIKLMLISCLCLFSLNWLVFYFQLMTASMRTSNFMYLKRALCFLHSRHMCPRPIIRWLPQAPTATPPQLAMAAVTAAAGESSWAKPTFISVASTQEPQTRIWSNSVSRKSPKTHLLQRALTPNKFLWLSEEAWTRLEQIIMGDWWVMAGRLQGWKACISTFGK